MTRSRRASWARWRGLWDRPTRSFLPLLFTDSAPIDLRILGRSLWRAALVGACAGLIGVAFFALVEYLHSFLLETLAGYDPLRAHGETFAHIGERGHFRPWLLCLLPAAGGLLCGLVTRLAPETRGGGTDDIIDAFHHRGGVVRRRVIWVKLLASIASLGTGASGGREGPTLQISGALGSTVGRYLRVSARERRILLVAGMAAGIAAVFRTPLAAALLATEILYRDGMESDAIVPSVLASVVAYSISITVFGESTLFAVPSHFPFVAAHLPLYALLAVVVSAGAIAFLALYRFVQRVARSLPGPEWLRPALGGLLLGISATGALMALGGWLVPEGQGLGILGGGYGGAQTAISGAAWVPDGWNAVILFLLLAVAKMMATSLSVGSGGSAGDFAPTLAIGGLLGGAFGIAAQIVLHDPRIHPGAFALVGMGVFYGAIAHVPLAALVMVCEMAGNYELLVPLMFALGIAFIALRKHSLYPSQVASARESPVHRDTFLLEMLEAGRVRELVTTGTSYSSFAPATPAAEMLHQLRESTWQDVFPVLDGDTLCGLVAADALRVLAGEEASAGWAVAADLMQPPVTVGLDDDLRCASQRLIEAALREIPVVDGQGRIVAFLDEAEIARVYLQAATRAEDAARSMQKMPTIRP
jgi:CIC family chloride channel protein